MRMADAIHNDQRMSVRLQGEKSLLGNDDGYLVVRGWISGDKVSKAYTFHRLTILTVPAPIIRNKKNVRVYTRAKRRKCLKGRYREISQC